MAQQIKRFFIDLFETKHGKREYWSITQPIQYVHAKFWKSQDIPARITRNKWSIASMYILDWLVMIITYLFAILWSAMPNPDEQIRFPIDPEFMRPFVDETISVTLVVILGAVVPAIIVVVFNLLFVRDGHDLNHGIMGVGFSLAMSTFWTNFLWLTIGGARPKLIYQCDPDQAIVDALYAARKHPWSDYVYLYASEVCKNKIAGLGVFIWTPGFPSGHASNVFAGWIYVMLYIGAKVSAWSFSTGPTYKFVFTALPCVAIPVFVACTRILNHAHFPHQVVVGSLIGIVAAVAAYRLRYCSLFGLDAHIPNFYMTRGIADHEAPVKPLDSISIEKAEKTENKNII